MVKSMNTITMTEHCWSLICKNLDTVNDNESFTIESKFEGVNIYMELTVFGYDEYEEHTQLMCTYQCSLDVFELTLPDSDENIEGTDEIRKELNDKLSRV
jgi:hypothetical protein